MPESGRDRSFVPLAGRQASAQVGHPSQAQVLSDSSKTLPAGREETAEKTHIAQSFRSRLPGLGATADPLHSTASTNQKPGLTPRSARRKPKTRLDTVKRHAVQNAGKKIADTGK